MKHPQNQPIESLAAAWTVETIDLSQRVAASIGVSPVAADVQGELLAEIRNLRQEMRDFRTLHELLQQEIDDLRRELGARRVTRLAPYSPSDNLMRLS